MDCASCDGDSSASGAAAAALGEPAGDERVFSVSSEITTTGKLVTSAGEGKTTDLPVESTANFQFRER
ncbi:MAG: hypothetical protein R3B90_11875 [Planctomycetaceae bacterium]